MAVTSGFFNSLNGDRRYNAEQMSEIFNGIINDGVFSSVGTAFAVTASEGNTVTIGIGRGWFNSAWIYNDAILPLTLSNSETLLNRIDAVVIEINHSIGVRSGSIKVVNGTPATTPENPTLANIDDVHQYPLAYIYRAAGSTSIVQANITNKVGTSDCPYVTGILEVQNIDNIVAQWQSEFDIWFANLEDSLSGDVAVKLANDILALQSQFEDLALYKTVYVELEDSQDNTIQDSNGNPIYGATTFGDSNTEGSSSGQPAVVSESPYKPGDTLTTARNDLDASWLLCNGAEITRTDYPQLAQYFPPKPTDGYIGDTFWTSTANVGGSGLPNGFSAVSDIEYINGQYVCFGYYGASNYGQAKLRWASSLNGPWSETNLDDYFISVLNVRYINGYYVAVGSASVPDGNRSYYHGRIAYSTSISGPWTTVNVWKCLGSYSSSRADQNAIYDIAYGNGYYVAVGARSDQSDYTQSCVAYSANLSTGWIIYETSDNINDARNPRDTRIIYDNGMFIIGGGGSNPAASYCVTPTSESQWTTINLGSPSNLGNHIKDIRKIGNGYAFTGCTWGWSNRGDGGVEPPSSYGSGFVYKADVTKNAYTPVSLDMSCTSLVYDDVNDYYVAFGHGYPNEFNASVAYSKSLSGPWTYASAYSIPSGNYADIALLTSELINAQYICGGYTVTKGTEELAWDRNAFLLYSDLEKFYLPSISLSDKTYTYIKAKED